MRLSDFDFELPEDRIAQRPLARRDASRLLVLERAGAGLRHASFPDLVELLPEGAVLVLNEARVIPARFLGRRATGGKAELLLIEPLAAGWEALIRCGGSLQPGEELLLEEGRARVRVEERLGGGRYRVSFPGEDALVAAERCGRMPLPPYVRREAEGADRETYQTVYARVPGAIAAPTAGLHFTPELLAALEARGVTVAKVVLHVGLGTFLPVRAEELAEHEMHEERYAVPEETRRLLESPPGPIVACGTTAVRALEAWARTGEPEGRTALFITPGYEFQLVHGLITNFHLPKSTLLMLVSAFAGRERVLAAYAEAVREGYRFYSYGDAMLIL
ncbi:MAG: tRNA preQ1(34) S-adenosylmethionine ribosyltransferase-isomerase QueA [Planctomycetota bacterium]